MLDVSMYVHLSARNAIGQGYLQGSPACHYKQLLREQNNVCVRPATFAFLISALLVLRVD